MHLGTLAAAASFSGLRTRLLPWRQKGASFLDVGRRGCVPSALSSRVPQLCRPAGCLSHISLCHASSMAWAQCHVGAYMVSRERPHPFLTAAL